jgi:hypothetical protein
MGRRLYRRRAAPRGGVVVRLCESLEQRTLLSVNINGTTGNDTIALNVGTGGVLQATVNATTTNYTPAQYAGGITIDTNAGTDTLNIAALPAVQALIQDEGHLTVNLGTASRGLQDIAATRVSVGNTNNSGEGPITLNVNDTGDPSARHATLNTVTSGNPGDTYNVLHGLSAGDIWFSVFDVPATTITTGAAADVIDVTTVGESGPSPQVQQTSTVTLFASHSGTQVNVGNAIYQPLYVEGAAGSVSLSVDESLNQNLTLQTSGVLLGNNVLGQLSAPPGFSPGSIYFQASAILQPVVINCGNFGNTIQVLNTPTNTTGGNSGPSINLNTGAGADHVTVRGSGTGTVLNINGQNAVDAVTIGNSGSVQAVKGVVNVTNPLQFTDVVIDNSADVVARLVTVSTFIAGGAPFGSVAGLAPGVINFKGGDVSTVVLSDGNGGNHFAVASVPQGTRVTLNTGDGNDQTTVTGTAPFATLNLNGQGGDDSVIVDYTASGIANGSTINVDGGPGANGLTVIGLTTGTPYTMAAGRITYPASALSNAVINYLNIGSLVLGPGTYNVNADLGPLSLRVNANANVVFNSTQHLSSLIISTGGNASLAAGALPFSKSLFLDSSLVIVPGGRLDLANNELRLHYASPAIVEIRALVLNAYSGGTWSNWGITTSAGNATHGIGYVDSVEGVIPSLPANTILVRWTRYGDLNLDGVVAFTDLLSFAQNYGQVNKNWGQGDTNYDGNVNFTDLLRLAQNYGGTAAAPGLAVAPPPPGEALWPNRKKKR